MARTLVTAALAATLLWGCTSRSSGGGSSRRDSGRPEAGEDPVVKALWKGARVTSGIGDTHNLLPQETALVRNAVRGRQDDLRLCFEDPIRKRGCRTGGLPAPIDAMLMIDGEGAVAAVRLVPDKNNLPRECHGAVSCIQDTLTGLQIPDLTGFQGTRQAYMTVTLLVPDEAEIRADAGEEAAAP